MLLRTRVKYHDLGTVVFMQQLGISFVKVSESPSSRPARQVWSTVFSYVDACPNLFRERDAVCLPYANKAAIAGGPARYSELLVQTLRRRRAATPRASKPVAMSAYVDGSGTMPTPATSN